MHKYIDISSLRTFKAKKSIESIEYDLTSKYSIKNIIQDDFGEYVYSIASSLYLDYKNEVANYESCIEYGMDARLLMELRKSAVILFTSELDDFYTGHNICNTAKEVKEYRKKYLHKLNSDYLDLDWQYYFLIRHNLGRKSINFIFDFEECYEDGDWRKQTNPTDYERDFIIAHTRKAEELSEYFDEV